MAESEAFYSICEARGQLIAEYSSHTCP